MKIVKNIFLASVAVMALASCMNDFDEPGLKNPPFGNNSIGEPNMTITEFKEKFSKELFETSPTMITEDIVLGGVIVSNDETGNVYKQIVISDGDDAMLIGTNAVGLYSYLPRGQKVAIDCKGLSIGSYGELPQIGTPYTNNKGVIAIGRMSEITLKRHIKLVGTPNKECSEMIPADLEEAWLTSTNKKCLPRYVRLKGVSFNEADGKRTFAPESEVVNNAVERTVTVGKKNIIFRLSSYADFANSVIPQGKFDITGVLTCYYDNWQFMLSSDKDLVPAE